MSTLRLVTGVIGHAAPGCTAGSLSGRASNVAAAGAGVGLTIGAIGEPRSVQAARTDATATAMIAALMNP
jgi:hypothetical protein